MGWKNIKSLFIVEDDKKNINKEKEVPKSKPKTKEEEGNSIVKSNTTKNTTNTSPTKIEAEKGEVKSQFVEHLLEAIDAHNMEGIDYLEFKNTLQSFSKMPMDENLKFESAITAVKSMGGSVQKILDSADYYLQILAKEESSFMNAVKRGKEQKVDGELKRAESLKKARQEKLKQIKQLENEIQEMTKDINSVSEKVMADQAKIDTKRNHFYASYEFVVNQIKRDISAVKKITGPKKEDNKTDKKA